MPRDLKAVWLGVSDYRLNLLGVRVWEHSCQLIARSGQEWSTLGARWELPVHIPRSAEELKAAALDTLRMTAYQYDAEAFAASFFASALPNNFAVIVRFTEVGTNASMKRFSRPGIILDRFSRSALRPSDTHCSTLNGFIGMVRGSNPSLASTAVFVSGGGTTVT